MPDFVPVSGKKFTRPLNRLVQIDAVYTPDNAFVTISTPVDTRLTGKLIIVFPGESDIAVAICVSEATIQFTHRDAFWALPFASRTTGETHAMGPSNAFAESTQQIMVVECHFLAHNGQVLGQMLKRCDTGDGRIHIPVRENPLEQGLRNCSFGDLTV